MTVNVCDWTGEDPGTGEREQCLTGFFSYVAPLDTAGRRLGLPLPSEEDAAKSALGEADKRRARRTAQRDLI